MTNILLRAVQGENSKSEKQFFARKFEIKVFQKLNVHEISKFRSLTTTSTTFQFFRGSGARRKRSLLLGRRARSWLSSGLAATLAQRVLSLIHI